MGVSVNDAGVEELMSLGLTKLIAERIIESRQTDGEFQNIRNLATRVKGLGKGKLNEIANTIVFSSAKLSDYISPTPSETTLPSESPITLVNNAVVGTQKTLPIAPAALGTDTLHSLSYNLYRLAVRFSVEWNSPTIAFLTTVNRLRACLGRMFPPPLSENAHTLCVTILQRMWALQDVMETVGAFSPRALREVFGRRSPTVSGLGLSGLTALGVILNALTHRVLTVATRNLPASGNLPHGPTHLRSVMEKDPLLKHLVPDETESHGTHTSASIL